MAADPAWDELWVYEHLSEYAASLIHKYYEPCGLRQQVLKEICRIVESESLNQRGVYPLRRL